ncbi:MAG TPA: hypothetical protein VMU89_02205 [Thermomicrobiaceae bacterium]|nr:hypothetical protein [Thermomicrobiaceae bacterium]
MAINASKGTVDMACPPPILATRAAAMFLAFASSAHTTLVI